jgi:hypothetical protein
MARSAFDYRRFALASALIIIIGIVLVILGTILQLLTVVITDSNAAMVELLSSGYSVVMVPVFLALFFWCGMRAARRYNFDAVGAAGVTSFSYVVIAVVNLVLNLLLSVIVVSKGIPSPGFGSAEAALAASMFGGASGLSGIGLSAVCGVGIVAMGALINFVVGGAGALFSLRKTVQQ